MADKSLRIIKKYSNRRLYDTESSSYITQDKIKEYVIKGVPFQVIRAKTGENTTRSVLLHIILDEEVMGVPLFTEEALRSILLFSGSGMHSAFSGFLEQMLPMLHKSQTDMSNGPLADNERMREQFATMQGMMLGNVFQEYVNRSMELVLSTNRNLAENAAQLLGGNKKAKPKPEKD